MYVLIYSFGRRQSLDSVSMQKMDQFASLLPVNVKVFPTPQIKVFIFQLQYIVYFSREIMNDNC
ncbi:hypothetical protein NC653_029981 [Populus alba x Populus x berolinensis]|uniref:Uncharacterized protein n=1 Tax=Populus alba x Populus x berolinensis TaxID=444605 RepID=A0AAD6M4H4_9ROSI|nr:hypothetical protein NC653_029981 [Populus alba x Populus x berolinensis]